MGDWQIFWNTMAFLGVVGVAAAIFGSKINNAMHNLEYYSSGHVTEHHKYEPFD